MHRLLAVNEFPNLNLSNSSALTANDHKDQIGRIWNLLRPDHTQPLELRALHPSKGSSAKVRHFRPNAYESLETIRAAFEDDALELNAQGYNIYTPLNPIKHDFCGKSVKDCDILCRQLLLVDIDRVADTKQPATMQDMNSAENLAKDVAAFLSQKGWPNPARMMSGNGFHLYFPLDDLPNTEQVTALVKATLKELSRRFDTDAVGVDTSVFNASRITKVPGTIMRKGEATEDRPHRMAKLLSEFATTRVTESMLAEIVALGEIALNIPLEAPRELAAPKASDPVTSEQLKSILASISSDVPRGNGSIDLVGLQNYWLGVCWAAAGSDLPDAMRIARDWSKQSPRYTDAGFAMAWNSYDPDHPNPIGIGSVLKLAKALGAQTTEPSFLQKLKGWSSTGDSKAMAKQMLEEKFVLPDLAILGQWTTFYASHNVGKTLLTLRLLKDSVVSGDLDGRTVFYINCDDNYRGSVEKLAIVEKYGIEMLVPHRNDFNPATLVSEMNRAVQNDEARNIVIILDTLKKFVDLMNKTESTKFGVIGRQFSQAGGTLIGLAHTNKHRDEDGKSIYSGTTDIADDCDCVYVIETIEDDKTSGKRTIQFRNEKQRGDVAAEKSFSYIRREGNSYEDLMNSVVVVDEETAKQDKKRASKLKQYHKDKLVIETIIEIISNDSLELTELTKRVAEETGESKVNCRAIVERYKGEGVDEYSYWRVRKGAHNRKPLELLTLGGGG